MKKINKTQLGLLFGGNDVRTSSTLGSSTIHDILHDENDNCTIDPGECIDIVAIE